MRISAFRPEPSPSYIEKVSDCLTDDFIYVLPWLVFAAGIAVAAVLIWQKIRKKMCVILYVGPDLPPMVCKVRKGKGMQLPTPVWEGYTFLGWETPDGKPYNGGKIYTDCCFVAKWEKNPNN